MTKMGTIRKMFITADINLRCKVVIVFRILRRSQRMKRILGLMMSMLLLLSLFSTAVSSSLGSMVL